MIGKNELLQVKESLSQNIGRSVKLTSKRGKKKISVCRGVIENIYPCIFTVRLDDTSNSSVEHSCNRCQTVSFSYADVLTKTIEIALIRNPVAETVIA